MTIRMPLLPLALCLPLVGGCVDPDAPCRLDSLYGDCWLPVSAQEFDGDWPLTVGAGELRCHQVRSSPLVLPVFRPAGSETEYSFGLGSQHFPDLFDADTEGLWACNPNPMLARIQTTAGLCLRVSSGDFADWGKSTCGAPLFYSSNELPPHPGARRRDEH